MASPVLDRLRAYRLPEGVLPLAPSRTPFEAYSHESLAAVILKATSYPEKRGMMSHAIRAIEGLERPPASAETVTIEAHVDARGLGQSTADALVRLGFELDGFAAFNPKTFDTHYTCKFKVDRSRAGRRAELLQEVRDAADRALTLLQESGLEGYVEFEVYPSSNRRSWAGGPISAGWLQAIPLTPGVLETVDLPCDEAEAAATGVPIGLSKRADIHVKVAKDDQDRPCQEVIDGLTAAGFYPVRTWAGNDVCTAQFLHGADALRVFQRLDLFFTSHGGATEMTLEFAPGLWRTIHDDGKRSRYASVPPVVLRVADL
jgi:hypothetical protein